MSAAERVAHAAKTIRARWERGVEESPQVDAAQALEDTGQLLDPEVADELVKLRAELDQALEDLTGANLARWEEEQAYERLRVALESAKRDRRELRSRVAGLESERHTTNEKLVEQTEACRKAEARVAELEAGIAWRDAERDRWADVHALVERAIDKGWTSIDTVDLEVELGPEPTAPSEAPCEGPPRPEYRVCRDLPETGGEPS